MALINKTGCSPPSVSAVSMVVATSTKRSSGAISGKRPLMPVARCSTRLKIKERHDLIAVIANQDRVGRRFRSQDLFPGSARLTITRLAQTFA